MSGTHRVIRFRIGEDHYCLSVNDVSQVIDIEEPREIPNSPEFSVGIQEIEGDTEAVELIDPRLAFNLDAEGDEECDRGIVLDEAYRHDGQRVGWIVDEVFSVERISRDKIDESVTAPGAHAGVTFDDQFTMWIDPMELFRDQTEYLGEETKIA